MFFCYERWIKLTTISFSVQVKLLYRIEQKKNKREILQESRAVAGNPRDAAVIFDP